MPFSLLLFSSLYFSVSLSVSVSPLSPIRFPPLLFSFYPLNLGGRSEHKLTPRLYRLQRLPDLPPALLRPDPGPHRGHRRFSKRLHDDWYSDGYLRL